MARAGPSLRARQVRSTLTELLYRRYPRLYAERHLSTRQSVMPFGFEHDDGWFAIVDVLSGLLEPRGVVARQVKEKLGGLRYYYRGGDEEWCRGAAQVAIALSLKVCQFSGRHGRLMALGSLLMTIDPHAPRALLPDWITDVSVLQSRISYTEDRAREAAVRALAVQRDVPPGWTDLVNALLKVIHWNTVTGIRAIWRSRSGGIEVQSDTPLEPLGLGGVAFAVAMAKRTHSDSGFIGPVDDEGRAPWPQPQ